MVAEAASPAGAAACSVAHRPPLAASLLLPRRALAAMATLPDRGAAARRADERAGHEAAQERGSGGRVPVVASARCRAAELGPAVRGGARPTDGGTGAGGPAPAA